MENSQVPASKSLTETQKEYMPTSSQPLQEVPRPENSNDQDQQSLPDQAESYKNSKITTPKSHAKHQVETCSQSAKKFNFVLDADDGIKLNFTAEIDQIATTNVMSYCMWLLLKKPMMYEIQVKVSIPTGIEVVSLGIAKATLKLQSKATTDKFLVVESRHMSTHLILSRQWVNTFEDAVDKVATITKASSHVIIEEKVKPIHDHLQ